MSRTNLMNRNDEVPPMTTISTRPRPVRRRMALALIAIVLLATGLSLRGEAAGAAPQDTADANVGIADGPATLRPAGPLSPLALPNGSWHPLTPARFYNSRTEGTKAKFNPGEVRTVPIAGRFGIPGAVQVKAVAMNVTVDAPTAASFVSVYPSGVGIPNVSSVNFQPGRTVPNLIIVDLGADGNVNVYNGGGQTHVILDVVGWFASSSGPSGGGLFPFDGPERVLDTRANAPVGGFTPFTTFGLGRHNSSPYYAEYTTAVVNATVQSAGTGFFTFYPEGAVPPDVSNVNFPGLVPGSDPNGLFVSNTVFAPLNASKTYVGYTESRPSNKVNLILDEVAAFDDDGVLNVEGTLIDGSLLETPLAGPFRTWDTRPGGGSCTPACPFVGGQEFTLDFTGILPDPDFDGIGVSALALNITIDAPTQSTFLTVYPGDIALPNASTLNFLAGQTVAHATIVRVDPYNPTVKFFMPAGTANLIVDFLGQFEFEV
jgi:hypothetical protein